MSQNQNRTQSQHPPINPERRTFLQQSTAIAGAALLLANPKASQAQLTNKPPLRELTQLGPSIYRTRENRHYGLLIETTNSIILFDTLNKDFASWLKAQIKTRFDKPVSYVIYSHNHADHISGGEVFADQDPLYISHELARQSIARMKVPTQLPTLTFDQGFTIEQGGKTIELTYHGPNDGQGSISLYLPEQKLLSAIDWLLIGRVPYLNLARYHVDGTIRSLYDIERFDFTLASPGHAKTGTKADMRIVRDYWEALRDGCIEAITSKTPLAELSPRLRQKLAANPDFRSLLLFNEWVDFNIKGVYEKIADIEGFPRL